MVEAMKTTFPKYHGVRGSEFHAKRARQARRLAATNATAEKKAGWKRAASAKIAAMTPEQARAAIDVYNAESKAAGGATIYHASIRELTGGFNSQSINFYVLRKLGERAGLVG